MPSKGKSKRDVNPTDAFRKMERNKEKKRNKLERQKVRADAPLRRDPEKCRDELVNLEMKSRHKLTTIKDERRKNELREYLRTAEFRVGAETSEASEPTPQPKRSEKSSRVGFVDNVGVARNQRSGKSSLGGAIVILPEGEADLTTTSFTGTVTFDPAAKRRKKDCESSQSSLIPRRLIDGHSIPGTDSSDSSGDSDDDNDDTDSESDSDSDSEDASGIDIPNVNFPADSRASSRPLPLGTARQMVDASHEAECVIEASEFQSFVSPPIDKESSPQKEKSVLFAPNPVSVLTEHSEPGAAGQSTASSRPSKWDQTAPVSILKKPSTLGSFESTASGPTSSVKFAELPVDEPATSGATAAQGSEIDGGVGTACGGTAGARKDAPKNLKQLPPGFLPPLPSGPPPKHAATSGIAAQTVMVAEARKKDKKRMAAMLAAGPIDFSMMGDPSLSGMLGPFPTMPMFTPAGVPLAHHHMMAAAAAAGANRGIPGPAMRPMPPPFPMAMGGVAPPPTAVPSGLPQGIPQAMVTGMPAGMATGLHPHRMPLLPPVGPGAAYGPGIYSSLPGLLPLPTPATGGGPGLGPGPPDQPFEAQVDDNSSECSPEKS
eukprot:Selendium_serpulae@DN5887_c0_g1_i3.p1